MLTEGQFDRVFPFHFTVGGDLVIRRTGPALGVACPDVRPGVALVAAFVVERPEPRAALDGAWLAGQIEHLFVLRHRASGLQLRGQWLPDEAAGGFHFIGSPWLTHPDQLEQHGLKMSDFALHDPRMDLLHLAQTQQLALDDSRQLAAELTRQREELRTAIQRMAEQNATLVHTEGRLREQEAEARKLALVAERTTNAVVVTDAQGRIEWVNRGFVRLTGYELEEVRGRTPGSVLQGPGTDDAKRREIRELLRRGEGFETEILNYAKSGRPYVSHIEVQPVRDEHGVITNFMAIQSDVTERYRNNVRRALSDAVSRALAGADSLSAGLESTLEAIARSLDFQVGISWEVSRDGAVLEQQSAWTTDGAAGREFLAETRNLTLRPGEGLPGRIWREREVVWIRDIGQEGNCARATVAVRAGLVRTIGLPLVISHTVVGVMEFLGAEHFLPDYELPDLLQAIGRQVGLFIARMRAQDALRQAKDAAETANRAKSDFLATVSHEIRTPMNSVLGMASLLRETRLDVQQGEFVEAIRTSSESLLEIIDDILDFSKIESSKLALVEQEFELGALVDGVMELLAPRAHDKGLEIAAIVDPALPRGRRGDEGRLRQVLVNLIGNAIKFTRQGEVVLRVEPEAAAGGRVRFTVADTGIGIPREQQAAVFEPFMQADNTSSRRFEGTGLGLSISKRLVELLGGKIDLESTPGGGSRFWFSIPLAVSERQPSVPADPALVQVRILVLDNHAATCEGIGQLTRRWGLRIETTDRVEAALDAMEGAAGSGDPFKVVLLDDRSLGEPGAQIAARIAARLGPMRPRIVLLGRASQAEFAAQPVPPIDARLAKPLKAAKLLDCLVTLLTGRTAPAAGAEAPSAAGVANRDLRILVVEDREINQRLARLMLERLGYRGDFVANGQEAVEAVQRIPYDVILMDCQMPVMDGYQATQEIRRREAQASAARRRRARIIAMTANAISDNRGKCLAAGMDDFISKPVRIETLREVLAGVEPAALAEAAAPGDADLPKEVAAALMNLQTDFGPDAAAEILGLFLGDTPARIADLPRLREKSERANLARTAHMMAGSCGIFGLTAMRQACLQLEQACGTGAVEDFAPALAAIEQEFTAVRPALERRLRELSALPPAGR